MNKLFSLLKATMSEGIQLFNYRGKTERSRRVMPIILGMLMGAVMLFGAVGMAAELKPEDGEVAVLSIYTMITTIIIVTEGVYKSGDLLFKPRDNDMLLAMPIKKSVIVLARIVKFYLFEMIYCLIFLLPAIIGYAMNATVGVSYYLVAGTMLLMVPVIPIAVSCVVGLLISATATKFKHRSLIQVILSFVSLFAIASLMLLFNVNSEFDGNSVIALGDNITRLYYPAAAFSDLATNFEMGGYLTFVVVNLVVVAVAVAMVSRFYFAIVSRINIARHGGGLIEKYRFTRHGQILAMVKKELTRYFSTPVLLMNTALGLVLFLVAVGAICFNFDGIATSLIDSMEDFPLTIDELRAYLPSVTFILVTFASLMTLITATMISLEGKAFNLLKSMPISGRKVLMSKVLAAMILIVPVTALGSIMMAIRFQFGILECLLIAVAVVAMPLVTELVGILINLRYPRFDAENDAVVVRQSASVMVATFLGLGMVLTTISLTFAVVFITGQMTGLLIIDAVFVIVALYLYFAVATRGEEKYRKLAA